MNYLSGVPEIDPERAEAAKERDTRLRLLGEANAVRDPAPVWTKRWPGFHELIVAGWEIYVGRIPECRRWHWRVIDECSRHWYRTLRQGNCRSLAAAMKAAEAAWRDMQADRFP